MDNMMRPRRPTPTPAPETPGIEAPVVVEGQPSIATSPQTPPDATPPVNGGLSARAVRRRSRWFWLIIVCVAVVALAITAWLLYLASLQPVDRSDTRPQKIVIESGESFGAVARTLQQRSIIHNAVTFELMARLDGKHNSVKAGTCTLYRYEDAAAILTKITSGCHDFKAITFYPGATLQRSRNKPTSLDVTDVLLAAGYSQSEIDAALTKTYTTKNIDLFMDKPSGTDLEGYVYGETYYVDLHASAEDVIQTALDQMASDIQEGGYIEKFRAHGLTLYQGITLASIVQRELSCSSGALACFEDQAKIAQVFYSRLAVPMTLGSDVTFYYAADKLGVDPAIDLDSPYNTRRYAGLPPGPIAAPGKHALEAVANPASTDYLFFLAGDDGNVYYARTDAEHQANVAKYCQVLCSEL